jgi:hypothetical protein
MQFYFNKYNIRISIFNLLVIVKLIKLILKKLKEYNMKKLTLRSIVFVAFAFLIISCNNNSIVNPSVSSNKNTIIDGGKDNPTPNIWVGVEVMQNHQVKPTVTDIIVWDSANFSYYGNSGWIQFSTENITSTFDVYIYVRWHNALLSGDCGHVQIKDANNHYLFDEPVFCTPNLSGGFKDLMTRNVSLNPNNTYYYILYFDNFH